MIKQEKIALLDKNSENFERANKIRNTIHDSLYIMVTANIENRRKLAKEINSLLNDLVAFERHWARNDAIVKGIKEI